MVSLLLTRNPPNPGIKGSSHLCLLLLVGLLFGPYRFTSALELNPLVIASNNIFDRRLQQLPLTLAKNRGRHVHTAKLDMGGDKTVVFEPSGRQSSASFLLFELIS